MHAASVKQLKKMGWIFVIVCTGIFVLGVAVGLFDDVLGVLWAVEMSAVSMGFVFAVFDAAYKLAKPENKDSVLPVRLVIIGYFAVVGLISLALFIFYSVAALIIGVAATHELLIEADFYWAVIVMPLSWMTGYYILRLLSRTSSSGDQGTT